MSLQDESGIPFSINHDQQSFRLLELPPPLLASLASSDSPPVLYLKSGLVRSAAGGSSEPNAVICTQNQTFELRQVQSSNVLYILGPSDTISANKSIGTGMSGVTALGQCKALLEVVLVTPAATVFLKQILPVYNDPAIEPVMNLSIDKRKSKLRQAIDSPFSSGEFDLAWIELCGFEIEDEAWRPSVTMLARSWASILTAATINGLDLTESFLSQQLAGMVEEDGIPIVVMDAIFERLKPDDHKPMNGCSLIDREKILRSDFLQRWQDKLPESWRDQAKLDALQPLMMDCGDGNVTFRSESTVTYTQGTTTTSVTASKSKSKWHERFKAAR